MKTRLWFVTDGVEIIAAYLSKERAEREKEKYQDDPDFGYFDIYPVRIDELDEYPDEFDYAQMQGLVE
jgi:hypothetical protein